MGWTRREVVAAGSLAVTGIERASTHGSIDSDADGDTDDDGGDDGNGGEPDWETVDRYVGRVPVPPARHGFGDAPVFALSDDAGRLAWQVSVTEHGSRVDVLVMPASVYGRAVRDSRGVVSYLDGVSAVGVSDAWRHGQVAVAAGPYVLVVRNPSKDAARCRVSYVTMRQA